MTFNEIDVNSKVIIPLLSPRGGNDYVHFCWLAVCLSVFRQDYSKCCGPIFMKIGGWVSRESGMNHLVFRADLDMEVDKF